MLVVALPLDLTCRTLFLNSGSATKKCILLPFSRTPTVIATSFSREQKVGGRHQVTVALPLDPACRNLFLNCGSATKGLNKSPNLFHLLIYLSFFVLLQKEENSLTLKLVRLLTDCKYS